MVNFKDAFFHECLAAVSLGSPLALVSAWFETNKQTELNGFLTFVIVVLFLMMMFKLAAWVDEPTYVTDKLSTIELLIFFGSDCAVFGITLLISRFIGPWLSGYTVSNFIATTMNLVPGSLLVILVLRATCCMLNVIMSPTFSRAPAS